MHLRIWILSGNRFTLLRFQSFFSSIYHFTPRRLNNLSRFFFLFYEPWFCSFLFFWRPAVSMWIIFLNFVFLTGNQLLPLLVKMSHWILNRPYCLCRHSNTRMLKHIIHILNIIHLAISVLLLFGCNLCNEDNVSQENFCFLRPKFRQNWHQFGVPLIVSHIPKF